MAEKNTGKKIIAQNKKAYHDYFVIETYEAGIALYGTEVKSVRGGRVNLKDSCMRSAFILAPMSRAIASIAILCGKKSF